MKFHVRESIYPGMARQKFGPSGMPFALLSEGDGSIRSVGGVSALWTYWHSSDLDAFGL